MNKTKGCLIANFATVPVKLLWSTGDGLCLLTKRLERGRFAWPSARDGKVFLTPAQLAMLLEGIDWRQPKRLLTSLTML
ncbi:IS66 family insertion sequence element accessory protein TnpB [Escherichia coli]|nr:IS66 family insertion sequence element accessory protein TnpB [Escherichia coli]